MIVSSPAIHQLLTRYHTPGPSRTYRTGGLPSEGGDHDPAVTTAEGSSLCEVAADSGGAMCIAGDTRFRF
jgi:hypothetical protein